MASHSFRGSVRINDIDNGVGDGDITLSTNYSPYGRPWGHVTIMDSKGNIITQFRLDAAQLRQLADLALTVALG